MSFAARVARVLQYEIRVNFLVDTFLNFDLPSICVSEFNVLRKCCLLPSETIHVVVAGSRNTSPLPPTSAAQWPQQRCGRDQDGTRCAVDTRWNQLRVGQSATLAGGGTQSMNTSPSNTSSSMNTRASASR